MADFGANALDTFEADLVKALSRARYQAVVADLLDAHEAGAPAGQLVDMLMDAAPLLAPPTMAKRDWSSPRDNRGRKE
jgi:hypothetical protein